MKINIVINFVTEKLFLLIGNILAWFWPLLADLEQRLIPVTDKIKPLWDDPIWQALIIVCVILLILFLLISTVKWVTSTGIQLLGSLWVLLGKLLYIIYLPVKFLINCFHPLKQKWQFKRLRKVATQSRMQGIVSAIKYITTSREWRYKTPWFLLLGENNSDKSALLKGVKNGRHASLLAKERDLNVAGSQWSFFDGGVLIDVKHQGGQATNESNAGSDGENNYLKRLCKVIGLILRHRPEKPIDAVILTVSASSLLAAKTPQERSVLGENLFQQLWLTQKKNSIHYPCLFNCQSV
jgi:type VI protein secretion system component VasK